HADPWQLLCATILSAQCTDARVNQVTPALFARYPTAEALAAADAAAVEEVVRSTGFFREKARSLMEMSQDVVARYGGSVPRTLDELVTLRGVGRKTANVLIGVAFGGQAVVVDTHVRRISRLLGWTENTDPARIERDLMDLLPADEWTPLAHRLIRHGRETCVARRPRCAECTLLALCPSAAP
ncbi:MAG: endonuclease III, partial [Chthonomonadales bacterium]|nr:endonuclease III [Chthonomonadales bacterium]